MSEKDTDQQEVIIFEKEVYIDTEDENHQVECGAIRHGIESIEGSESGDYRTIDDVATAKETTPKNKEDLALLDAATEIIILREENKKQKETLLADKQKIETELIDKNILPIVSRNYEKKLEMKNIE